MRRSPYAGTGIEPIEGAWCQMLALNCDRKIKNSDWDVRIGAFSGSAFLRLLIWGLSPLPVWGILSLLEDHLGSFPFIIMFLPVIAASHYGGKWAGLASTAFGAALAWNIASSRLGVDLNFAEGAKGAALLPAGVFLLTGALATFIYERLRRSQDSDLEMLSNFRELWEGDPYGKVLLLSDGRIAHCNAIAGELFGAEDHAHLVGFRLQDLLSEQQPDGALSDSNFFQNSKETPKKSGIFECNFRRKDGLDFTCEVTASRVPGNPRGFRQVSIRDISLRKALEASVKRALDQLRLVTDSAPVYIAHFDANKRYRFANEPYARLFGFRTTDLVGVHVREVLGEKSYLETEPHMIRALAGLPTTHEWRLPETSNSPRVTLVSYQPELSESGQVVGFVAAIVDITEQSEAEKDLRRFKSTLDATRDCVFMFDPETLLFFYTNFGASEQVGYTQAELLNLHPYDIKPEYPEPKFRELLAPLLDGRASHLRFQTVHRHKDGHDVPVEVFLQYVAPRGEPPRFVNIVSDLSETQIVMKQLEKQIAERNTLLKEVHHRVKNNLQVVASLLSFQQQRATNPSVALEFQISRDRISAIALVHEQLYALDGLASIDASPFLRRLGENLLRSIDRHGMCTFEVSGGSFRLSLNEGVPYALLMTELLTNSLKHAFPQGRSGALAIELLGEPGHSRSSTVRDNGVGFPIEKEPNAGGSLGLRLVSLLAKQLHGTIERLPIEGGTSYRLMLPPEEGTV